MVFATLLLSALALLTDNAAGEAFPEKDRHRIRTDCTLTWRTEGKYAADREILRTRVDASKRSALLNGRISGDGGFGVWGAWNGTRHVAFTIDLKKPHLVSRTVLWSAENRGLRGLAGYTVGLGLDGTNFTEVARRDVPPQFDGGTGNAIRAVPLDCALEKPALARYVRFRVDRNPARHQMVLGEVAVFGEPVPGETAAAAYAPEKSRPTVSLRVDGFSSGAAAFDWAGFPAALDVKGWRFYSSDRSFDDVRADGVKRIAALPADKTSHVLYPLVPYVTNHYAVAAVYADGECTRVRSVPHAPRGALDVTRFRDMLGVNYFWGGGGADSKTKAWYDVAADFLSVSHFRKIRWWHAPEWAMKEYLPRRIEVSNWTGDIENAKKYGIYLHDMGNEPELNPATTPRDNVATYRRTREKWRAAGCGNEHVFYGPSVNICTRGAAFFREWIDVGGAEIADAYDFHTYCAGTSEFIYPEGYPSGSPEAIIPAIDAIRAFLKEKGLEKPLVCSEWGYSDTRTVNPHMADPTPLRKAQFLVRGCIIHHRLGFRRLYIYSFYDEGYDPDYSEHLFGMLTRDLQKKPAFYALETMGAVLGDTLFESDMKGCRAGDFGYVLRNVDKPGFVSVVWNGAHEKSGLFRTSRGSVEIVSMFGERRTVKTKPDGTFLVRFGPSPVYIVADGRVEMVSSSDAEKREAAPADRLAVKADADLAVFNATEKPEVTFTLVNPFPERVEPMLTLKNSRDVTCAERRCAIAPGGTETVRFPAEMKGAVLEKFVLSADYDARGESFCESKGVWVRVLGAKTEKTCVSDAVFANLPHPVKVLGNEVLEITVDPVQGGQILEIFDKRSKTNQLAVDYDRLDRLSVIPYAYGLWSSFNAIGTPGGNVPKRQFRRASRFAASADGGTLVLRAEERGLGLTMTMRLDGERFRWAVEGRNGTDDVLRMRWYVHPEYTIAGLADSYRDYMLIPTAKGEQKLVFWSGLGERKLADIAAGRWQMIDPVAGYEIRQDFVRDVFDVPKLWFGVGAWNVEMATKFIDVKPDGVFRAALDWRFMTTDVCARVVHLS